MVSRARKTPPFRPLVVQANDKITGTGEPFGGDDSHKGLVLVLLEMSSEFVGDLPAAKTRRNLQIPGRECFVMHK